MRAGIAEVGREGVGSVALLHASQALGRERQRLAPADLDEAIAEFLHGPAQPVGVALDIGQGGGLRTDVPAREHVVGVAADPQHPLALDLDLDAAVRLAKSALPVDRVRHLGPPARVCTNDTGSRRRRVIGTD